MDEVVKRQQIHSKKRVKRPPASSRVVGHDDLDDSAVNPPTSSSKIMNISTGSHQSPIAPEDGHGWSKYGQKPLVGTTLSRAYYRCGQQKSLQCTCKKTVDWDRDTGDLMRQKYTNDHNHPVPEDTPKKARVRKSCPNFKSLKDLLSRPASRDVDSLQNMPRLPPRFERRLSTPATSSATESSDEGSQKSPFRETPESKEVRSGTRLTPAMTSHAQLLFLEPSVGYSGGHGSATPMDDSETLSAVHSHPPLFPRDDGDLFSIVNSITSAGHTRGSFDDDKELSASRKNGHSLPVQDPVQDVRSSQVCGEGDADFAPLLVGELDSTTFDVRDWFVDDQPTGLGTSECWEDTQVLEQIWSTLPGGDESPDWPCADLMGQSDWGGASDACGMSSHTTYKGLNGMAMGDAALRDFMMF